MRLTEDRPPNNITSPGVVPLDLAIPALRVSRDREGVFTVHQAGDPGGSGSSDSVLESVGTERACSPYTRPGIQVGQEAGT